MLFCWLLKEAWNYSTPKELWACHANVSFCSLELWYLGNRLTKSRWFCFLYSNRQPFLPSCTCHLIKAWMTFVRPRCLSAAMVLGELQALLHIYNTVELRCRKGCAIDHPACYMTLGLQTAQTRVQQNQYPLFTVHLTCCPGYHISWLRHPANCRVTSSPPTCTIAHGRCIAERALRDQPPDGEEGTSRRWSSTHTATRSFWVSPNEAEWFICPM